MPVILVADPLGGNKGIMPSMGTSSTPSVPHSSQGFAIGMWYKSPAGYSSTPIWTYTITLEDGSTTNIDLYMLRVGNSITLSLVPYGGSPLSFFPYVDDLPVMEYHHLCMSFDGYEVTGSADGVALGPTKVVTPVPEGASAKLALYPTAASYFDITLHSKPLSNSTLLYYAQNLGEMNPPE